mmetsp:Transcript_66823/g.134709  ORF Transcript_66823/g.134709 Transcript_66823/m.134709 type:complete len:89 (+) Transcript_66823:390-656(+)
MGDHGNKGESEGESGVAVEDFACGGGKPSRDHEERSEDGDDDSGVCCCGGQDHSQRSSEKIVVGLLCGKEEGASGRLSLLFSAVVVAP